MDPFLENLLSQVELAAGDQLALLVEGDIRALGTVTSAEPGQYAWDQVPVNFPSGLLVNPTSEVRELNAAERRGNLEPPALPAARRGTLRRTSLLEDRAGQGTRVGWPRVAMSVESRPSAGQSSAT